MAKVEDVLAMVNKMDFEGKDDLTNSILSLVEDEKQKGIDSYRKKDSEVMKYKNTLKELGWDSEKYADVQDFVSNVKKKDESVSKKDLTISELNARLMDFESKYNQERENAKAIQTKSNRNKMIAELTSTIGDKLQGSKYIIDSLISNDRVGVIDDKVVFKNGEELIPFDMGITKILEENKDLLKVTQKNGAQTAKSDASGEGLDFSKMSKAEIKQHMDQLYKTLGK